jgi:hypothetical protein
MLTILKWQTRIEIYSNYLPKLLVIWTNNVKEHRIIYSNKFWANPSLIQTLKSHVSSLILLVKIANASDK